MPTRTFCQLKDADTHSLVIMTETLPISLNNTLSQMIVMEFLLVHRNKFLMDILHRCQSQQWYLKGRLLLIGCFHNLCISPTKKEGFRNLLHIRCMRMDQ